MAQFVGTSNVGQGRPAPKAAPGLARARPPSTGKPGLRRFGQGDAYSDRCQTVIWGAPVHARETPPLAGLELGDTVAGNRRPQPPSLTADVTLSRVLICMKNQDIL